MSSKEYTVGYGKPPVRTRFRKGISGNPQGRPRKSKNTATIVRTMLEEPIVVTMGGEQIQMTVREAMLHRQRNKALSGDIKAVRLFISDIGELAPALTELERENEAKLKEQYRLLKVMTPEERRQVMGILRIARKRADEADAPNKEPIASRSTPAEKQETTRDVPGMIEPETVDVEDDGEYPILADDNGPRIR